MNKFTKLSSSRKGNFPSPNLQLSHVTSHKQLEKEMKGTEDKIYSVKFVRDYKVVTSRKIKGMKNAFDFCFRQNKKNPLYGGTWCFDYFYFGKNKNNKANFRGLQKAHEFGRFYGIVKKLHKGKD